jgi:hypothetical protein
MSEKLVIRILLLLSIFIFNLNVLYAQENDQEDLRLSLNLKYLSRFVSYGIDLADEQSALSIAASLSHRSGFSVAAQATRPNNGAEEAQQWAFSAEYEKELFSSLTLSADLTHYIYQSDTVNVLSQFSNSISIGANLELSLFDIGFSFDQFLGGSGASYYSFDVSTFRAIGPFYLLPLLQVTFMSQTVEESYLVKLGGKKKENLSAITTTTSLTGLANTMFTLVTFYPLSEKFNISIVPSIIISHQSDLSSESVRFVWNAGIRYNIDL